MTSQPFKDPQDFQRFLRNSERLGTFTPDWPGALLGRNPASGEGVWVKAADLRNGLSILGRNGTGKSVTMEHLATADIEEGRGLIVLDPHGTLVNRLLQRIPADRKSEVVLLDATDDATEVFALNPYHCDEPTNERVVAKQVDQVHQLFKKVWPDSWGAYLDDLIPNSAYLLLHNSPDYTLLDLPEVFRSRAFRAKLLPKVTNRIVREFWEHEYANGKDGVPAQAESTMRRVRSFARDPILQAILGQELPTVNWGRWMEMRNIVLINLPIGVLGEHNVALLGTMLLQQILAAAFDRISDGKTPTHQVMLYADEFQRFATPDFATLLREARKTGVTTVIAHQDYAQLRGMPEILAASRSARNFICFGVNPDDAAEAVKEFAIPAAPPEPPTPNPIERIERSGHANPQVVASVQVLNDITDRWWRAGVNAMHHRNDNMTLREAERLHSAHVTPHRERLRDQLNRFCYHWMCGEKDEQLDLMEALGMYYRMTHVFQAADPMKDGDVPHYLIVSLELASKLLVQQPIAAAGAGFHSAGETELRNQLRSKLVNFPTFHCHAKLLVNGSFVEQDLVVRLPDPPPPDRVAADEVRRMSRLGYGPNSDLQQDLRYVRKLFAADRQAAHPSPPAAAPDQPPPVRRRGALPP